MSLNTLYRSVIFSAAAAGMLIFGGCSDLAKSHDTLKTQMTTQWNLTRLGIMYQLAEQQYKVGDYDKCEDTLKDAFAAKTPFAPIYILDAKIQIERGNLETAANSLNTAIRIDAKNSEPYYLLGVLYQRWQKPEVACDYYNQAWSRKPDEARYLLATVEMEISMGKLDLAKATLESKLVYFEQSAALRVALARIATLRNDWPEAAKQYRDASTLMPDDKNLQRSYAEALFYAGDFAAAAPLFEDMSKQVDITDRTDVLMMLGQSYMGLRRYEDARNTFQQVIRDKPEETLAYLYLGQACVETGEWETSLSAARKVLQNEPDNVPAMILTALVQQKQKKWTDAQAMLEQACKIAPADATVLCMLGIGAQESGNKDRAAEFFAKAVALNPKDAWAAELLGRVKPAAQQAAPDAGAPAAANVPAATNALPATNPPAGDVLASPGPAQGPALAPARLRQCPIITGYPPLIALNQPGQVIGPGLMFFEHKEAAG